MLTPFTTTDGKEIWINAIHVRAVRAKTGLLGGKKAGTEIWMAWDAAAQAIEVGDAPAEAAMKLNGSMPAFYLPVDDPKNVKLSSD